MSMSLFLTRYTKVEEQKYCEDGSKNLAIVEITDDIYKELIKEYVSKKEFWEKGLQESYSQEVINNENIDKVIEKCICKSKELMKEILKNNISKKEEDEKFDKVNILLGIRSLLNKKKNKYYDQDEVFILVG